jgi:hypothetical protein
LYEFFLQNCLQTRNWSAISREGCQSFSSSSELLPWSIFLAKMGHLQKKKEIRTILQQPRKNLYLYQKYGFENNDRFFYALQLQYFQPVPTV